MDKLMTEARDLGRVYVTGADGFIGSHLVEALLRKGLEVTALCIYNSIGRYGWLDCIEKSVDTSRLNLILGDVRDSGFIDQTVKGHNTVFHLASLIAIPYSYVAPQSYFDTNINGALHIANACIRHNVGRLIHTSTSEVYGTAQFVPISETHPLVGQSPYSASKIGADVLIDSFVRSFDLKATTLRPFNTFGPRQSTRAVIPTVISQILAGQSTIQLGSISPTRDFNYVTNTVDAFVALATADSRVIGQTFNAGSGREISIGDTVQMLSDLCHKKVTIISASERIRPKNSEVERLLCDNRKLTEVCGWSPNVSLEDGLERTIEWMKWQSVQSGAVGKYSI
jgi:NAD dependent epimerase/dehydratase